MHRGHINKGPEYLDVTDAYISRVEADGGAVDNPQWVDDHYAKLDALGWLNQLVALHDPASGQKSPNGKIDKLYDLSSNQFDLTQATAGDQPSLDTSVGWGALPTADFTGPSSIMSHPDNDTLDIYENSAWFILWFNVASNGLNTNQAFGKWAESTGEREFSMRVRDSISEVDFNISSGGTGSADAGVVYPGSNQWVMFYGGYDDTNNSETIYASVNDGTVNVDTLPNSPNRFTAPYEYGGISDIAEFFEGYLGLLLYGKRPNIGDALPHEDGTLTEYYTFTKNQAGL